MCDWGGGPDEITNYAEGSIPMPDDQYDADSPLARPAPSPAGLRRLLAEATPRPWGRSSENDELVSASSRTHPDMNTVVCYGEGDQEGIADAALIVAAVNALPALLAVVDAAERAEDEMNREHAGCDVAQRCFDVGHSEVRHRLRRALDALARLDGAS
jgi:hypothetical protein